MRKHIEKIALAFLLLGLIGLTYFYVHKWGELKKLVIVSKDRTDELKNILESEAPADIGKTFQQGSIVEAVGNGWRSGIDMKRFPSEILGTPPKPKKN